MTTLTTFTLQLVLLGSYSNDGIDS